MKTFLYAEPNGGGGLRVISSISENNLSELLRREELDPQLLRWAADAEVGQHWHAEGTFVLVRTS